MRDLIEAHFKEAKESNDPDIINSLLIELGKNPSEEFLRFIDYFIDNLEEEIYKKIELNLIYAIGEFGYLLSLKENYLQFLYQTYYKSDRWIRNEIIQAIDKISKNTKLNKDIHKLIGNALRDDYNPIKINALKTILNIEISDLILDNLLFVLNSKDSEVLEACRRTLEIIPLASQRLFKTLDNSENYKILKLRGIRFLLMTLFQSLIKLEDFRNFVENSDWEIEYKEKYLKELDTLERILIRNM
ncbi:MAG: hypothetical protein ACFFEN_15865 [Candidatus Thorarchaeota archaeon]